MLNVSIDVNIIINNYFFLYIFLGIKILPKFQNIKHN